MIRKSLKIAEEQAVRFFIDVDKNGLFLLESE